jgi:glycine/D-amino acid oxidase-like deaminating enzyme/nitrite reductase/ring-hydroxylating ferredoxin subunit
VTTQASLWLETAERAPFPPLAEDVHVDACVVGGGITGVCAALALQAAGASVALLEARFLGGGATGYTTAKLSALHGLTYARLERTMGEASARVYAEANQAGVARAFELAERLGIECDLRRKPNVTYTEDPGEVGAVEREVAAARRAGLPAELVARLDLPFDIAAAVRVPEQGEFHPVRFVEGVAAELERRGVRIHEGTMAVGVDAGSPCRVRTSAGRTVTAGAVIVATHLPFLDRGLYFARCHPERSYVVAAPYEGGAAGEGMYLSTESPSHSIRVHRLGSGPWLLVGGESHKTGQGDAEERYERLSGWMLERFGIRPVMRWATQDQMPADGVPFIGPVDPVSKNVFVATGFRKWGLALGIAASELLTAWVEGRDHPWRELFDTRRLRVRAAAASLARENANVALRFFGDRLVKRAGVESIQPGEGRVVGTGLGQTAVHRDSEGRLHALSARCTHLGCIVNWNSGEQAWDCPCHGSRFAPTGEVIMGPAVHPLEPREPPGSP